MKPSTDLFDVCQQNSIMLQRTFTEIGTEGKQERLQITLAHLNRVKTQRQFYENCCKIDDDAAASYLMLSFDYAQNVSYSRSPQQVGPAYFKSSRKCSLVGIHDEISEVQTNYLLDEAFDVGKGPNAVISQLYHYLQSHPAENLTLFCDNCVAQSKNNCMIHYSSWRMNSRRNKSITLNFLLTGHTKFSLDRSFRLIKLE